MTQTVTLHMQRWKDFLDKGQRLLVILTATWTEVIKISEMSNARAQYWVWTLNNYTIEEKDVLVSLVQTNPLVAFLSFGEEVGENGTPHLQGHLELTARQRFPQVKAILGQRVHLEVRRGSFEQAQEYCEKDGAFSTFGERVSKGSGKRTDLDLLAQEIRDGRSKRELAEEHGSSFIKYSKGIDNYYDLFAVAKYQVCNGPWKWAHNFLYDKSVILWGAAGIGKTEYAKYLLPNALFVSHMDDLGGFNSHYDGIIFDDMSFIHLPRTAQIHILDVDNQRSIHIRYKTATIPAHTKKIFLTNEINGRVFDLQDAAIARRCEVLELQ